MDLVIHLDPVGVGVGEVLVHRLSDLHLHLQTVEMHKEKVARREIGILTTIRRVPRGHKIIPPTAAQLRPPYSRQPISYHELDGLGHGMKVSAHHASVNSRGELVFTAENSSDLKLPAEFLLQNRTSQSAGLLTVLDFLDENMGRSLQRTCMFV